MSFLGYSNRGKTSFIEAVIRVCTRRGIVAAGIPRFGPGDANVFLDWVLAR